MVALSITWFAINRNFTFFEGACIGDGFLFDRSVPSILAKHLQDFTYLKFFINDIVDITKIVYLLSYYDNQKSCNRC